MALAVHAGNYEKAALEDAVIHAIRERRKENATGLSMNDRVGIKVLLDGCHRYVESTTERLT
jgi:hypothetical protein